MSACERVDGNPRDEFEIVRERRKGPDPLLDIRAPVTLVGELDVLEVLALALPEREEPVSEQTRLRDRAPRVVLPGEDEEVSAALRKSLSEKGLNIQTSSKTTKVEKTAKGVEIEALANSVRDLYDRLDDLTPELPEAIAKTVRTLEEPRENHMGLYIIRQCVDSVKYSRTTHGENCVQLVKTLTGRPNEPA